VVWGAREWSEPWLRVVFGKLVEILFYLFAREIRPNSIKILHQFHLTPTPPNLHASLFS